MTSHEPPPPPYTCALRAFNSLIIDLDFGDLDRCAVWSTPLICIDLDPGPRVVIPTTSLNSNREQRMHVEPPAIRGSASSPVQKKNDKYRHQAFSAFFLCILLNITLSLSLSLSLSQKKKKKKDKENESNITYHAVLRILPL